MFSLAKRVEAVQGRYGVQSRNDGTQGSLFWFEIPYRPDDSFANVLILSPAPMPSTFSLNLADVTSPLQTSSMVPVNPIPHWHILVVDDSPAIIKMVSMSLKRQGHQVEIAENGEIAVKKVLEKKKKKKQQQEQALSDEEEDKGFDLILMDLQMPIMDGLEATRRLRAMEKEEEEKEPVEVAVTVAVTVAAVGKLEKRRIHHPIIGMSANSDNETVHEALASGMDDFIAKPFSIEAFNRIALKSICK